MWEEICVITDLILRGSWHAVQSCDLTKRFTIVGKRVLWLDFVSLMVKEKYGLLDAPIIPIGFLCNLSLTFFRNAKPFH